MQASEGSATPEAFAECIAPPRLATLAGCEPGCAPTLQMLQRSTSLTHGNFSLATFGQARSAWQPRPDTSICVSQDAAALGALSAAATSSAHGGGGQAVIRVEAGGVLRVASGGTLNVLTT